MYGKNTFGRNLRYLRKKHGLSQRELADKFGYKAETTIQHWESGRTEPSMEKLRDISNMFHVDMLQLLTEDLETFDGVFEKSEQLTHYELMLVYRYRALNEDGQEKIWEYVNDLTASGKYKKHTHDEVMEEKA